MKYLSGVHSATIQAAFRGERDFGLMTQPRSNYFKHVEKYSGGYAYDNGAFGAFLKGTTFDEAGWRRQLHHLDSGCLFAVVPDVVGDHTATRALWNHHVDTVKATGVPAAFVLQNGCTDLRQVPRSADAVFIGGDDAYKLGPEAARVTWQAQRAGLWVHMGRVNSLKRWSRALAMGCDSADGTYLRFGPQADMCASVMSWLRLGRAFGGQLDLLDAVPA